MLTSELKVGRIVRVKDSHKSKILRGLEGPIKEFYMNPGRWMAVKVELQVPCGVRTFQPTQLEIVH